MSASFRLFASGDEVSTRVAKMLQGCEDVQIVKSNEQERVMPAKVSFANLIFPVAKAARKGEVPQGTISGDPVIYNPLDEDDEDAKAAAKRIIRAYAKDLDADDDLDDDEKKRRLRAFAKRNGVLLKDESDDEDERYDADSDSDSDSDSEDESDDSKAKAKKALKRALKAATEALKDDGDEDSDADDDDEMDDDAKRARGVSARKLSEKELSKKGVRFDHRKSGVSFASTVFPKSDGDRAMIAYDISSPYTFGPRAADEGQDILNRQYADAVRERLGGGLRSKLGPDGERDGLLPAGAGDPWFGTSRDVPSSGFRPMRSGEGNANHTGGEDRGGRLTGPNQGRSGPYNMEREDDIQPGDAVAPATLPGGMRVMSPSASGIRGPASFRATFNDSMLSVLKSAPRRHGTFRSLIEGDGAGPEKASVPGPRGDE